MNCPFTKKPSRILSILCVLALLTSLLAGCSFGKDPDSTGESQGSPNLNLVGSDPSDASTDPEETVDPDKKVGVVTQQVNVYNTASDETGKVIGYLDAGTEVEILQEATNNGVQWGLIRQGWICLDFVDLNYTPGETDATDPTDATEPEDTQPEEPTEIKGVITATQLYIRKEASADSESVGTYIKGDVVSILETKNGWGRTSKGWIKLEYVKTSSDGTVDPNENNNTTTDGTQYTVTANELNIRQEADGSSTKVGAYKKGDTITVIETKNGWGRTDKGWVSMNYLNAANGTGTDTPTNTTSGTKGVVVTNELNIRKEASTNGERVGAYSYGDRVTILETKNGWGRTDKGWISLNYVYQDGTSGTNSCKGIVIGNQLNVRSGPGTNYDRVKTLNAGARVNVLERIKIGNTTWGCIDGGWISMDYVYVDGTTGEGSGTGTITGDDLNIRSGPGTNYDRVGSLSKGDTVKILAQFKIGDTTWACIDKGWISMQYVEMAD